MHIVKAEGLPPAGATGCNLAIDRHPTLYSFGNERPLNIPVRMLMRRMLRHGATDIHQNVYAPLFATRRKVINMALRWQDAGFDRGSGQGRGAGVRRASDSHLRTRKSAFLGARSFFLALHQRGP